MTFKLAKQAMAHTYQKTLEEGSDVNAMSTYMDSLSWAESSSLWRPEIQVLQCQGEFSTSVNMD